MSDRTDISRGPAGPIPFRRPGDTRRRRTRTRPRVKKLRLAFILLGLGILAVISAVFGMMMAVASDIPALENRAEYQNARNSILLDDHGRPLGVLTGQQNRILVREDQISPAMKHAIIAIEDQRFFENPGIDFRGIARAFLADLTSGEAQQGASTITQQFVKKALAAEAHRTVFEKLREAAIAYHLTRKWSKQKILTEYLNIVYFGNGAYGIESAARTYFGKNHPGCGTQQNPCAAQLTTAEAALLAGIVQSPTAYDPIEHPVAATTRRNVVLEKMEEQGYITPAVYRSSSQEALPTRGDIDPPVEKTKAPYFTAWVKEQVVDKFGAQRAFEGGLRIRTSLDLDMQQAAQTAIQDYLAGTGMPAGALVAIDNRTGQVRAMVGGTDYAAQPFNLATQGHRQPGSSFKPFVLAEALRRGISPTSVWPSRKRVFDVPHSSERFVVNNYEGEYVGSSTLADALRRSDNSVFAAVGIQVGTGRIARLAQQMGIRSPVSHNYAITLGGLRKGVSVLDMAHAYETLAEHGRRITAEVAAPDAGPTGIDRVTVGSGEGAHTIFENKPVAHRVLSDSVADETASLMQNVVQSGTGRAAYLGPDVPVSGKTGTTENYGDAWFVGFTDRYTVAVWVGYPDKLVPMTTQFRGGPVSGGTYPALIWHDFMTQVLAIEDQRAAEAALRHGETPPPPTTTSTDTTATTDTTTTGTTGTTTDTTTTTTPGPTGGAQPQTGEAPTNGGNGGTGQAPAGGGAPQTLSAPTTGAGGGGGGGTTGAPPAGTGPAGGGGGGGQTPPAPKAPTPSTPPTSGGGTAPPTGGAGAPPAGGTG